MIREAYTHLMEERERAATAKQEALSKRLCHGTVFALLHWDIPFLPTGHTSLSDREDPMPSWNKLLSWRLCGCDIERNPRQNPEEKPLCQGCVSAQTN
jgi:hypothetical protein